MTKKKEWTIRLALLTGAIVCAVSALLIWRAVLLVSWPTMIAVIVPWVAISVALRIKQETWGREGTVLDWWSVPHFGAGVLLGLFGLGGVTIAIVATAWEGVELASRVEEYPANRVADIVLAVSGWALANLLAAGPFAVW